MTPRFRQCVSLVAVLLCMLGSPMAWAQWFDGDAGAPMSQPMNDSESHCAGHMADSDTPSPETPPCCGSGDCHCAVPAMSSPLNLEFWPAARPASIASVSGSSVPDDPLDDALRPPIR